MADRPLMLDDYIGQDKIKQQLNLTIKACDKLGVELPHMLFSGPPGLGKTTIAQVIANEFNVDLHIATGTNIRTLNDLRNLISPVSEYGGDIVFIDEIHGLPISIEEMLYTLMEDKTIECDLGDGPKIYYVPAFTLIGATTLMGDLSRPLRDRFKIHFQMENYTPDQVCDILANLAMKQEIKITEDALNDIAVRCKGVARIAINYFERCRDYAVVYTDGVINKVATETQFEMMGIDEMGLDFSDRKILNFLSKQRSPIGIAPLASGCNMDEQTIKNVIEPYLTQIGFIIRSSRGREITDEGLEFIGVKKAREQKSFHQPSHQSDGGRSKRRIIASSGVERF